MLKHKRWVQNPLLTSVAFLGALGSGWWAWQVSLEDAILRPRVEQLRSLEADDRVAALAEIALVVSVQPEHHAAAFPLVLEAATDHDANVRSQALITLGDLAGQIQNTADRVEDHRLARNTILNHFRDHNPQVREAAVASVVRTGPVPDEALFVLTRFAGEDRRASMRSVAVERLGQMEHRMPDALAAILRAVADPDPMVRESAVKALAPWIATDVQAMRAVIGGLRDKQATVRQAAAWLILKMTAIPHAEVLSDLLALFDLPDHWPGGIAALALPKMGESALREAAPSLIVSLRQGLKSNLGLTEFSRHLQTLLQLGAASPAGVQTRVILGRCLLNHEAPGSRQFAAYCLSRYGSQAVDSLPALNEALNDPDDGVRDAAKRAINAINADQAHAKAQSVS